MNSAHVAVIQEVQALSGAGRDAEARELLQRAMRRGSSPALDNAMAITLTRLAHTDQALFFAERAAASGDRGTLLTLANILTVAGKLERAVSVYERVVAGGKAEPAVLLGLANGLRELRRYDEAEARLREALSIQESAACRATLATVLLAVRRHEEAWSEIERCVRAFPDDLVSASGMAQMANYMPHLSAAACLAAQRHYGEASARLVAADPPALARDRDPERRLTIGFLSPDLRQHSVAYFIEPVLRTLPRERCTVACYPLHEKDDRVSERLRGLVDAWRPVAGRTDQQIADQMRSDGVDVLVELAGHMRGHRLGVLQRRAAPVQVSYLGYPNITGVRTIDARLVDSHTDPGAMGSSEAGRGDPERLVTLGPSFLCFSPERDAPAPARSARAGGVVFGSFNLAAKINARVVEAWAEVLNQTPGSTLLVKSVTLVDESIRRGLASEFERAGCDAARVRVAAPTSSVREHLAMYADVDIALDTFPYNGTTTTCEALWQGVPVVVLAGDRHASRVGVSLLTNIGAAELIAPDLDAYVRIAAELARDPQRIDAYRAGLRAKMERSPVCDADGIGARFEGALRGLWRGWCAAAPPA